jgi:hypothetical protein
MRVLKVLARKATEAPLLAVVLLTSSIVGADMTDGLQQGEEIVVLNVENMT